MKLKLFLTLCTNFTSKQTTNLNVEAKTITLLGWNMRKPCGLESGSLLI